MASKRDDRIQGHSELPSISREGKNLGATNEEEDRESKREKAGPSLLSLFYLKWTKTETFVRQLGDGGSNQGSVLLLPPGYVSAADNSADNAAGIGGRLLKFIEMLWPRHRQHNVRGLASSDLTT